MKRKAVAILAAGTLVGLLPALTSASDAEGAPAHTAPGTAGATVPPVWRSTRPVTLCGPGQRLRVKGPWGDYLIKNNDYYPSTAPECITHYGRGPNFLVSKSKARAYGSESEAYPNIFSGCSWNVCSDRSVMPARLFALHHPWVSWYANLRARGKWDANLDMWLSKVPRASGQVTGAEVMIWMQVRGFGPVGTSTKIDGIRWHLSYWRTRSLTHPHMTWPLVIFRAVRARTAVHRLYLLPFFRLLRRLHLIRHYYYLDSVHAGFEIWNGGRGLRMKWFREHNL